MDATTRQIIAFHVGDRSRDSGKALWADVPLVYREHAPFHTDQYAVYKGVIPAARHWFSFMGTVLPFEIIAYAI